MALSILRLVLAAFALSSASALAVGRRSFVAKSFGAATGAVALARSPQAALALREPAGMKGEVNTK
jgi:hypothetical protein